jgi:hypothetical protein
MTLNGPRRAALSIPTPGKKLPARREDSGRTTLAQDEHQAATGMLRLAEGHVKYFPGKILGSSTPTPAYPRTFALRYSHSIVAGGLLLMS